MNEKKDLDYSSHRAFFSFMVKLPTICMFLWIGALCIWGIIDSCVLGSGGYYGVMRLPDGLLNWLVWTVIGVVCGVITYVALKMSISYKVLVILNLEKIAKNTGMSQRRF